MYQGFYNLASGMLTQTRNLNVISNNMVNLQTAGYKSDTMVSSTFSEEMLYRTGTVRKGDPEPLATTSKISTAERTYVNYTQGNLEETEGIYDFALYGDGFFCIQTQDGERYTRNGSFAVDAEGYLIMPDLGRVLSTDNQPIQINNENFTVDGQGLISVVTTDENGAQNVEEFGTIKVVDFEDYDQLHKEDNGVFSTDQAQIEGTNDILDTPTQIVWKAIEKSNTNMVQEMTAMMSSQRALQSAAQMLKMYDSILSKASTDVGKL